MSTTNTFLQSLANRLIEQHRLNFDNVKVVLPNKRAKLFLLQALKNKADVPFFAPEIITIEDFIYQVTKIQSVDRTEILFIFYEVYKKVCEKQKVEPQDFEYFSSWGNMLLSDFNEIDRYLLEPNRVFSYLKDIEDIKHWAVDVEQRTNMIENYLKFWDMLPVYYEALTTYLTQQNIGYQGHIYRKAVENISLYTKFLHNHKVYFAGFNALNQAEEKIIQYLLSQQIAEVIWDIDKEFIEDPFHDAGYFARKIKQSWSYYTSHPFMGIVDEFGKEKNIEIIETPKAVGQVKIVAKIVEQLWEKGYSKDKTAIVLADENLLIPLLYALPKNTGSLNITMGYKSKSNPIHIFINKWFKAHLNAYIKDPKNMSFYHKDLVYIFSHPMCLQLCDTKKLIEVIQRNNYSYLSHDFLMKLLGEEHKALKKLLQKWTQKPLEILYSLQDILFDIKMVLESKGEYVNLTFLYSVYKRINQVILYLEQYDSVTTYQQLYVIFKQIIELSEVSFEGEPLEGLQIMGVLESRVLDFENVIITSLNEGKLPAGKGGVSFIPNDVKRELGLPTFKEKDAIYSYHFYHLLTRAKNVYLLYNSDTSGMESGEKSRFITQLEIENKKNHQLTLLNYYAQLDNTLEQKVEVQKSESLKELLRNVISNKGLSPTAFSKYLRNPMQFYKQNVLKIREVEEVEEDIAANTFGTIIHQVLENLYKPYLNIYLNENHINQMILKINEEVDKEFAQFFPSLREKNGKNLIAYEIAKRNIEKFLKNELHLILQGDEVKVLSLETKLEKTIQSEKLPYPVKLIGTVDRIEIRNGILHIIDYKTGTVDESNLKINNIDEPFVFDEKREKLMQLLIYGLMYGEEEKPLRISFYSFKKHRYGYLSAVFSESKQVEIPQGYLSMFEEDLIDFILEIIETETFEEIV